MTGEPDFDPHADVYEFPRARQPEPAREEGSELIPSQDLTRSVDDWGRSEAFFQLVEPVLDFYYRYWFRVEQQGIENVPATGGALLVSNHSGAVSYTHLTLPTICSV